MMTGSFDLRLVALSVMIATLSAYASFDLVGRVASVRRGRPLWLLGGSVTLGVGVWTMHYIGMEAYRLPVPVKYDWPTVLISLLFSIVACWCALLLACKPFLTNAGAAMGSVVMGGGMAAMLYLGLDAIRLPARLTYSPFTVCLAITISFAISYFALRFAFTFRHTAIPLGWRKVGSALLMGIAIATMHYVGGASARLTPAPLPAYRLVHAVSVSGVGVTAIALSTILILSIALVTSAVDRRTGLQAIELIRTRQRLQTVFDTMSEGVLVVVAGGSIIYVNRAAAEMIGTHEGALRPFNTATTFDLVFPDGRVMEPEEYPSARTFLTMVSHSEELIVRRKDTGAATYTTLTTVPMVDSDGDTTQVLVTLRDITERKEMDAARTLVHAIVTSSPDAIIGFDLDGAVTSWNGGAQTTFGYTSAEMIGQSIEKLVPPDRVSESEMLWRKIRAGEYLERFETERSTFKRLIDVDLTVSPIFDAWGKVVGGALIARDITSQRQLRQQLHQSQKMDAVGQLTGGIAHDFNNLLGIIIGNLGLAERLFENNAPLTARLDAARKAASRGADLTRRLLTFSRIDDLRPALLPVNHAIRNTLELVSRAIGPEITISTDFEPKLPNVFADPAGFESTLLNLAVNARDAMPKGGCINITAKKVVIDDGDSKVFAGELTPGNYVCVSVADTGTGMSQSVRDRAFEPFYSTKQRGRGTGLGLAMVYGFSKQSNGMARISSELGRGTTVSLYLPAFVGDSPQEAQAGVKPELLGKGARALVVDDEPEMLDIACEYLKDMGFAITKAKDPIHALALLTEDPEIAMVVTDILMPGGMNGVELAQKARGLNPRLKLVFTSGFPAGALAEKSLLLPDEPLLNKPYNFREFSFLIADAWSSVRTAAESPIL